MVSTKWISGDSGLEDAWHIRTKVFVDEQGVPPELEIDGSDAFAIHLLIYDGALPVATGRIIRVGNEYILGRIAVLREHRGLGYGDFVLRLLIRRAFELGANRQVIHSQVHAAGFYERLGFVRIGEEYMEAGIPHINMERFGDISGCC